MKILLLAPLHREREYLKERSKLPFPRFQAQSSWSLALEALGHKVSVFRYTDSILIPNTLRIYIKYAFERFLPTWRARYNRLRSKFYFISLENFLQNRKLFLLSKKIRPDLVIISGGISTIYPSTIKKIKVEYGCQVLLFSGVNPDIAATHVEKIMVKNGIIDIVVENDIGYAKRWEKLGAKKTIVLPISSVDPVIHNKIKLTKKEIEEYTCDICFVGTLTEERQEILKQIQDGKYNLKIWGDIPLGTKLRDELKTTYHGIAFGSKMVKIFNAAKIVLNFQPRDMTHGGNMRTFEIPGCYAFQLADKVDPNFLTLGSDYASFNNYRDLKAKIKYYLQNESKRLKIAEIGAKRVRQEHTYEKHFKRLLSEI